MPVAYGEVHGRQCRGVDVVQERRGDLAQPGLRRGEQAEVPQPRRRSSRCRPRCGIERTPGGEVADQAVRGRQRDAGAAGDVAEPLVAVFRVEGVQHARTRRPATLAPGWTCSRPSQDSFHSVRDTVAAPRAPRLRCIRVRHCFLRRRGLDAGRRSARRSPASRRGTSGTASSRRSHGWTTRRTAAASCGTRRRTCAMPTRRLLELAAPVFGPEDVDPIEADLTVQHNGEPIGERMVITGRVSTAPAGRSPASSSRSGRPTPPGATSTSATSTTRRSTRTSPAPAAA